MAWNAHKRYLAELEGRGVPIVPTQWVDQGDDVDLAAVAAERDWNGVVAKPAVGAGAEGLIVVPPGDDTGAAQEQFALLTDAGDTMVQPFLDSVRRTGELSVVVIDGRVSHAVRKRPAVDDVRTQIEFGADYEAEVPDPETCRLAEHVAAVTPHDLVYARVDLLTADDGSWRLGELEVIEPALLLAWSDDGADRLAEAVLRRIP